VVENDRKKNKEKIYRKYKELEANYTTERVRRRKEQYKRKTKAK
jgi:hypothetical protein